MDNLGASGYTVWRNGVSSGKTTAANSNNSTVSAGSPYIYWVIAYDAPGNACWRKICDLYYLLVFASASSSSISATNFSIGCAPIRERPLTKK
jgi:hypothetical protein